MLSHRSHLPQELIEPIFDDLDVKSLCACTLLSSSLVAPSQRLIFRSLVIRIPHPDFPVSVAEALFAGASHILRYVRDLTVHLNSEAESFVPQSNLLASILPSFHHLECLSIKGPLGTSELEFLGWDDTMLPLQSAIHNLTTSTNLWTLDLHGFIDVPPSLIILALSSDTKLGLRNIKADPSASHVCDRPATLRTEQITLRNVQGIAELILPDTCTREHLDNIRWLAIGMDPYTHVESRRFIAATANTLRHLELRCKYLFPSLLVSFPN
ncbi:hypothetical protein DFH08DRAFT_1074021 [Mycena albidolilacea]|uniref:F-box domain-containing protein n=1 Tax=Mycena albidolilacea TaxID=1033008 RepID=A0AAD7AJI5_9AGAR|nr:hypothetical protein DFH08DRAFT_1074021 [Mycena albidolilacea]